MALHTSQLARFSRPGTAAKGQAMLIMVGISLLVFLVTVGLSLGTLHFQQGQLNLSEAVAMQLRMVAQSGIQEALATRFVPRSNRLNFSSLNLPTNLSPDDQPIYRDSGRIMNNGNLVGLYRYVVLGGDAARDATNGNFQNGDPVQLTVNSSAVEQPFVVVSQGAMCIDDLGNLLPDTLIIQNFQPACRTGQLSRMTLMSSATLNQSGPNGGDLVNQFELVENPANVALPTSVMTPWGELTNRIDFERVWTATESTAQPLFLITYPIGDTTQVSPLVNITSNQFTLPFRVGADHAIRLFFRGEYDYRSLYNFNPTQCVESPSTCTVRIEERDDQWSPIVDPITKQPRVYNAGSLIPILPGSTQMVIFPPATTQNTLEPNKNYALMMDANFQDSRGQALTNNIEIRFTVSEPPVQNTSSQTGTPPPGFQTYPPEPPPPPPPPNPPSPPPPTNPPGTSPPPPPPPPPPLPPR